MKPLLRCLVALHRHHSIPFRFDQFFVLPLAFLLSKRWKWDIYVRAFEDTYPLLQVHVAYIRLCFLLTIGISLGLHESTSKLTPSSPQRPIHPPANLSKFPGTWSRQMAPSRSPLDGTSMCRTKITHCRSFPSRFKGIEMFPHCSARLFAGISFDLAFSCK